MELRPLFRLAVVVALMSRSCLLVSQTASEGAAQADAKAPLGSADHPVRVSSGVMMGQAIRQDRPVYPPPPRCGTPMSGSGVTVLHAMINPEGKVERLEVISAGRPEYRDPVLDAVRRWTYKPYMLNGRAVWVETQIILEVQMGCRP